MNEEVVQFSNKMKDIQEAILDFLEEDGNEENLFSFLDEQKIQNNKNELKDFLHMISKISKNYYHSNGFFTKIEKIIKFYENDIRYYSNLDIFNIFKGSKRILVFLFEQQIIHMENLIKAIIQKEKYINRDYDKFFCIELQNDYYSQLNDEEIEIHKEKRRIGENDCYICGLIRNDSVEDFISHVNRINLNLNSLIPNSIYETNQFLFGKKITLIEYSAFFGSIQILRYLFMNNVKLNSEMWGYSIHGQNPIIIHFLEENNISPQTYNYLNEYIESIKCHHIDIMKYFKDNFYRSQSVKNIIKSSLRYFNYISIIDYLPKFANDLFSIINYSIKFDQISLLKSLIHNYQNINSMKYSFKHLKTGNVLKKRASLTQIAIEKKRIEILKILLLHPKIDLNCEMFESISNFNKVLLTTKETSLSSAIKNDDMNIIDILLSNPKTNVNYGSTETCDSITTQKTPLILGIEKENIELIKALLNRNDIDVNSNMIQSNNYNKTKKSCLYLAVEKGNCKIVELLLSKNEIDVNFQLIESKYEHEELISTKQTSILQAAIEKGNCKIVELLLSKNEIDVNQKSIESNIQEDQTIERNSLSTAIEKENIEIIKLLLSHNDIDVNATITQTKNNQKIIKSVLNFAIEKGNAKIVQLLLLKSEIDVNFQLVESTIESNKKSRKIEKHPLYIAVEKENIEIVSLLLLKNDIKINNRSRILTETIENYEYKKKKKQSSKTKKIIKTISDKKTALHRAVELKNYEIISLLLHQPKIDINAKDENGLMPNDYTQDAHIKQMFFIK